MKHKIKVTYTVESVVDVEIPPGLTEPEVERIVNEAAGARVDAEAEDWEWEWVGAEPEYAPDPYELPEPPADCWVQIGDHRWATDGWVQIRDDAPRPDETNRWKTVGHGWGQVTDSMAEGLIAGCADAPVSDQHMRFRSAVAAILRAGTATLRHHPVAGLCAVVERDGEVIAIVMPLRDGAKGKTVDVKGEP